MATDITPRKPRSIDFTFEGKPLFVRRLPLRLGLKLQSFGDEDSLPPEIVAEIISECVVNEDGKQVWSEDDVLGFDMEPMLKIFSEVSNAPVSAEEAEKN